MAEREQGFGTTQPPGDEAPSQALLPVTGQAVLLLCSEGSELDALCARLLELGMRPMVVASVSMAPSVSLAPEHCIIEYSLDRAPEYLGELSQKRPESWPVALVDSAATSARAFASGAVATVSSPIVLDEILACLRGQRARQHRGQLSEAVHEHDQRVSAATAFESMLRTLGHELRTPLATALANMEYLAEVTQSAVSPMSEEEHLAVVTDSLEAMQQLRTILEGLSVLIPRAPSVLEQVRLWSVAQQVVDELPNGTPLVELQGDPQVRGWGDESTLVEVTSTLVKRAIRRLLDHSGPRITIHVYGHGSEARLTVREPPNHASLRRTSDDPFALSRSRRGADGGLQLAAARHSVVKMGGTMTYLPQKQAGSAFRVGLRLVQGGA